MSENEMTDKENMFMWYTIALQALHEIGRPLLLKREFVDEVIEGKWKVLHTRTDDGGYLYKAERKED